jgi:RNA polymerase sigma factor (sigma-70 family)
MAGSRTATLSKVVRSIAETDRTVETDRELLRRFSRNNDQAAFEAVVIRHTGMVLGVCRRALPTVHDAEDACQATFLVLANKAKSVRWDDSVANWLYTTARRVAHNARVATERRMKRETRAAVPESTDPVDRMTGRELLSALDVALDALASRYREPLVLCYLEGLTRDEAAARLGIPLATLHTRIDRGRKRLHTVLTKAGCALGVGLLAFAVTSPAGASPPRLVKSILTTVSGFAPAAVSELAKGVVVNGTVKKSLLLLFAAVGAIAVGTGLGSLPLTAAGQTPDKVRLAGKAARETPKSPPPAARPEEAESITWSGSVVDAKGKPVAGAKVYRYFVTREDEPVPVRATTDADGRFRFTITRKDVPLSANAIGADPLQTGFVVAKADGYTYAWGLASGEPMLTTLQVAKDDAPLTGRIVDLQGKPIAGVKVTAYGAASPGKGDLGEFRKALEDGKTFFEAMLHAPSHLHLPFNSRRPVSILPSAKTDADGRFRLEGFAREQLVDLRIEGPEIETQDIWVMTGDSGPALTLKGKDHPNVMQRQGNTVFLRNGFTHPAAPGVTVTGVVRDRDTGKPIPGVIVESYRLAGTNLSQNTIYRTTTDAAGRYTFSGLPRGTGNRIRFRSPVDRPYLPTVKEVPDTELFKPAALDVALKPGLWVEIKATDKTTGESVPGYVSYMVYPETPPDEPWMSHPEYGDAYDNMTAVRNDGTYRFAAVPLRAILAFRADWDKYPIAPDAATVRLPSGLSPSNFQAFVALNPKPGDGPVKIEIKLDAGKTAKGRLVDPDGKPLTGAIGDGLRHDSFRQAERPFRTDEFTAMGLTRPRLLVFAHVEKKLTGSIVVSGDEKEPIVVKLQPWGEVSGRLLDAEGKPIASARLAFTEIPPRKPGTPADAAIGIQPVFRAVGTPDRVPRTDAEGRFRADGLVPGLKYNLAVYDDSEARSSEEVRWTRLVFRELVLKSGETKDLGDVTAKPFPKE